MYRRRPRRRLGKRAEPAPAPRQRRDRIPPSEARRNESDESDESNERDEGEKTPSEARRKESDERRQKRNFEPFVSFVESIRSTTKKTGLNSQKASYLDRLFDFLVLGSMV